MHELSQIVDVSSDTTDVPNGCEKQIRLTPFDRKGGDELEQIVDFSPHTVEDHVKNLYDKVGVASRQELVARVFLDEYLPDVAQQTPLTSRGRVRSRMT